MMLQKTQKTQITLATLAATLIGAAGNAPIVAQAAENLGQCIGVNSCKGQSTCQTAGSACAGQNACKGKGWVKMDKKSCQAQGGKFVSKPAK